MSIKFKNKDHEKFYEQCLGRTGSLDPYHKAFFYTMGIPAWRWRPTMAPISPSARSTIPETATAPVRGR